MADEGNQTRDSDRDAFQSQAARRGNWLVRDYVEFLRSGKKWYMTPIILFLLVLGAIVVISATAAAPFIYTLF